MAATRLAGGFTVTVQWPRGGREGEKQGARRAAAVATAAALLLLLTKRRGDAGLLRMRVCGFWGSGCAVRCSAVQRSAAKKLAGWGAGGSRN